MSNLINELTQLKTTDVPKTRDTILEEQNNCCGICGKDMTDETGVSLDHQHKLKSDPIGVDGGGLVRGVCCRSCNVWEGKIWNNTGRYRQPDSVNARIEMLQELISYYERGTYPLIHPSEKKKEPTVSKSNYNKLKKVYDKKAKFPEYPKSKKLTKRLAELFEFYNIPPYN